MLLALLRPKGRSSRQGTSGRKRKKMPMHRYSWIRQQAARGERKGEFVPLPKAFDQRVSAHEGQNRRIRGKKVAPAAAG